MNFKEIAVYKSVRKLYHEIKTFDWDVKRDNMSIFRDVRKYHNLHKGEKCVIIGNGPSLRIEDLNLLAKLGICTFACNRITLVFSQTEWRPTYYFISDAKLLNDYSDDVEGVPPKQRFFPKEFRNRISNGVFYNTYQFMYEVEGRFSKNAAKGIYPAASVTTEMIQMAYYMGFHEIYLIGVDFNYSMTQKDSNGTYVYHGEDNYFIKGYLKEGEVADQPNVRANLLGFEAARAAIETDGRVIQNATRGGKLEVFQRVDLDELFNKWRKEK